MNTAAKAGIGIGVAAGAGLIIYYAVSKQSQVSPPTSTTCPAGQILYNGTCTSAILTASAEYSDVALNTPDVITATLTDTSGTPLTGVPITFAESGGATSTVDTDAYGNAEATVSFTSAGTYTFQITAGSLSTSVTIVAASVSCPCGQYYSNVEGKCVPYTPTGIDFYVAGSPASTQSVILDILVFGWSATLATCSVKMRPNPTPGTCPASESSSGSEQTISGTVDVQGAVVDASGTPIGCADVNLSVSPTLLQYTDGIGLTYDFTVSLANSSVTADSSGYFTATVDWSLTVHWPDVVSASVATISSEELPLGSFILTGTLSNSNISGEILSSVIGEACLYWNAFDCV